VIGGVKELVNIGVIPVLRPYTPHPLRHADVLSLGLSAKRPDKERLLSLAEKTTRILLEANLDPSHAKTMCLACGGCDLVPVRDVQPLQVH
ncbi:MAG: hypothetical protein ACXQS2_02145, partial [Methermicoccaceae archaeon]